MLKLILIALLPFLGLLGDGANSTFIPPDHKGPDGETGTLEKMIVASGSVAMNVNVGLLDAARRDSKQSRLSELKFDAQPDSFFTILVFNDELRGPLPGSMRLVPRNPGALPAKLDASLRQLVIDSMEWGGPYDLAVRDGRTGMILFDIEGSEYEYDATAHLLSIHEGRLLISKEFAAALSRPSEAGTVVGKISLETTMRAVEVTQFVDGEAKSDVLPALRTPESGSVPGPDVIVGDLSGLAQFGSSSGTQVGLAIGTDSCNLGTVPLDWFATPANDHPDRFEQIGQSNVKHAFTALQNNICNLGCVANPNGTALGSGCSDPYSASLNSGPALGSRAWINPFTGAYPRADSATPPNNHNGHTHTGPAHRILTEISDLNTSLNLGATYYAESQYVTPHEYAWCHDPAHPERNGECNMNNNVSHRQYTVTGSGSPFSFAPAATTVQSKPAISEWAGSTAVSIQPDPGNDGIGTIAYKVTNPSPGLWHYEYAIYNQNLDRAIQSFSLPMGAGVTLSNVGFHAPPQQPGWTFDGTVGNTGYSALPWAQTQTPTAVTWSSETFAQNQNANAVRWGTLYNIRFDSNRPPTALNATVGFLKTGAPITVAVQAPSTPAFNVTISGQVLTQDNRGLRNATVILSDSQGTQRVITTTSALGFYSFDNVLTGDTYTIAVRSKLYRFNSFTFPLSDNLTNVNFVGQE
ncbi:MAG: carboxypeptidase-like regulatory domain-containing protein [Acidobacteriota bacterium]